MDEVLGLFDGGGKSCSPGKASPREHSERPDSEGSLPFASGISSSSQVVPSSRSALRVCRRMSQHSCDVERSTHAHDSLFKVKDRLLDGLHRNLELDEASFDANGVGLDSDKVR